MVYELFSESNSEGLKSNNTPCPNLLQNVTIKSTGTNNSGVPVVVNGNCNAT